MDNGPFFVFHYKTQKRETDYCSIFILSFQNKKLMAATYTDPGAFSSANDSVVRSPRGDTFDLSCCLQTKLRRLPQQRVRYIATQLEE